MRIDVVMPKMGESIQEGKILKWVKNVGDKIDRDEVLLEISTDKVDTEVPAPNGGILVNILANVDDTVEVGKVIAVIETDASAATISAPAPAAAAPAPVVTAAPAPVVTAAPVAAPTPAPVAAPVVSGGTATDVVMPKMGESIQEGKVLKWLKAVGDKIDRDEVLLEISTDKVDTEVPAPVGGIVAEILANVDDVVEVGKVIAR
ncbi:MAG: biotin/lipoyl-containing protein, partial [Candidatus Kapaibacterium sp.]